MNEEKTPITPREKPQVPIWERATLTVEEAAAYSGIGKNKIRSLTDDEDCPFVLWVGSKRLIKRKQLDEFIERMYSI
ncbi:MAG: excisionase [Parabacteroides sp.]|nr:excisionase [Parabacteroides sp.]